MGAHKYTVCTIEGCEKPHKSRGYCNTHYYAQYRAGKIAVRAPGRPAEVTFWEKVEKTDTCWLWTASKRSGGYGQVRFDDRTQYAHRVSYEMHNGPIPSGKVIDHICGVRHCVNPEHLRLATLKQNSEHRTALKSNKTSKYRGVYWRSREQKWCVIVVSNGVSHWGGGFSLEDEAARAAIALRNRLFTHNIETELPAA